jgi:hypothetical protein
MSVKASWIRVLSYLLRWVLGAALILGALLLGLFIINYLGSLAPVLR